MESVQFCFFRLSIGAVALLASFFQYGCASSGYTPKYSAASTGVAHTLEVGTVVNARRVIIDGQATWAGVYGGAAAGGAIGSALGTEIGGTSLSRAVGGAGGLITGAIVGPKIEKKMSSQTGDELTIEMESGKMIVVVQQVREPEFYPGERVRVHADYYGNSKVFHIDEDPYVDPDTAAYLPPDFDHGLIEENTKKPRASNSQKTDL